MVPRLPRPPLPALPGPLAHARTAALARGRRASVHLLMRASNVPALRPVAELGFRVLFDALAPDWEAIRRDPTYGRGFVEALACLPKTFRPARALDVACGTGAACGKLLERWPDLDVTGTDISPRMVEEARRLVPGASFQVASVHRLPFEDGEFDLVTALDGLIDPVELLRVVKPGGRLLIVYSKSGTTPISRPLDDLAEQFRQLAARPEACTDGAAHALVVRAPRSSAR